MSRAWMSARYGYLRRGGIPVPSVGDRGLSPTPAAAWVTGSLGATSGMSRPVSSARGAGLLALAGTCRSFEYCHRARSRVRTVTPAVLARDRHARVYSHQNSNV